MDIIKVLSGFCCLMSVISGSSYNATNQHLDKVPNDVPSNVTKLILSRNLIQTIGSAQFTPFLRLKSIILDNNRISNVSKGAFCNNATTEIDLSRNKIGQFPDFACVGDVLELLDLSGNDLIELTEENFADLSVLEKLSLSGNKLTSANIQALLPLANTLSDLDLSSNSIEEIGLAFKNFPKLTNVSLNDNSIRHFADDAFLNCTSLKSFACKTCELDEFPVFLSGGSLNRVNLADNNITNITLGHLKHLPELRHLIVRGNYLGETALAIFQWPNRSNLVTLNIAGTNIPPTVLHKGAFDGFSSLRSLYLGLLNLTTFPDCTPIRDTLRTLDLNGNRLNQLSSEHVEGLKLQKLVINGNDFRSWRDIDGIFSLSTTLKSLALEGIRLNDSDRRIWQMPALVEVNMKRATLGCLVQVSIN